MKIAYNCAYIQIETFNCTFAKQTFIVYFYICSNFQDIAMSNTKYKCTSWLSFANNVRLYINSQQTINMAVDIGLHRTSTDISPNLLYRHANMEECQKHNPC